MNKQKIFRLIKNSLILSSLSYLGYLFYKYNIYYENLNFNEIEKDDITSKNKQIKNNPNTDVDDDIEKLKSSIKNSNPFNILNSISREEYLLNEYKTMFYTPCLTNKLFVSTNLYGHELIRYYDF